MYNHGSKLGFITWIGIILEPIPDTSYELVCFIGISIMLCLISTRCNIYISRLCHDASPSVCDVSALAHYS